MTEITNFSALATSRLRNKREKNKNKKKRLKNDIYTVDGMYRMVFRLD